MLIKHGVNRYNKKAMEHNNPLPFTIIKCLNINWTKYKNHNKAWFGIISWSKHLYKNFLDIVDLGETHVDLGLEDEL